MWPNPSQNTHARIHMHMCRLLGSEKILVVNRAPGCHCCVERKGGLEKFSKTKRLKTNDTPRTGQVLIFVFCSFE